METVSVNGVIYETQPIHLPKDYLSQFNFLDLGAKHGKIGNGVKICSELIMGYTLKCQRNILKS